MKIVIDRQRYSAASQSDSFLWDEEWVVVGDYDLFDGRVVAHFMKINPPTRHAPAPRPKVRELELA
jgi:hypothetical protein